MKIGIDVGGTHTKFGVVNGAEVTLVKTEPTIKNNKRHFLDNMKQQTLKIQKLYGTPTKIGVAIAGVTKENKIIRCPNLPSLDGVAINFVHEVINDARAAGLAEFHYGALQNTANSLLLTLGTGIGGAVFLDGQLVRGRDNVIGEIGHLLMSKDNKLFEFEKLASGRALTAMAKERYPNEGFTFGARAFFGAVHQNDERAMGVLKDWIKILAVGVANLVLFYNPEVIAFGGGISEDFKTFCGTLEEEVKKNLIYKNIMPELKKASFGNLAGVFGATI